MHRARRRQRQGAVYVCRRAARTLTTNTRIHTQAGAVGGLGRVACGARGAVVGGRRAADSGAGEGGHVACTRPRTTGRRHDRVPAGRATRRPKRARRPRRPRHHRRYVSAWPLSRACGFGYGACGVNGLGFERHGLSSCVQRGCGTAPTGSGSTGRSGRASSRSRAVCGCTRTVRADAVLTVAPPGVDRSLDVRAAERLTPPNPEA